MMHLRPKIFGQKTCLVGAMAMLVVSACVHPRATQQEPGLTLINGDVCAVTESDLEWLALSIEAWRGTISGIDGVSLPAEMPAVLYDSDCQLTLNNAMTLATGSSITVEFAQHDGTVSFPNDDGTLKAPIGPMSATMGTQSGTPIFIMSLPSLWEAGGVDSEELGRGALMTAVLLHEAAHVFQFSSYGEHISKAIEDIDGAEEFDDDSLQERFEGKEQFAGSIAREQALFLKAAEASDQEMAIASVREALDLMKRREGRFIGEADGWMIRASDLFWTLEGSGQWIGYRWLIDVNGGRFSPDEARAGYGTRGRWWSQSHGFSMALALDRIDPDWTRIAFGTAEHTLRDMLEIAVCEQLTEQSARRNRSRTGHRRDIP